MSSPNLYPLVWATITAQFSAAQQSVLAQYLSQINRQDAFTKGQINALFDFVDGSTTAQELLDVIEVCKRLAWGESPKMFYVNEGEDFALQIDLESGRDFTGYFMTIRQVAGMVLLSANDIAGDSYTNAPIQYITISDLTLTAGNFYKCVALLEHPAGPIASGNAATNLTDLMLIVGTDIDT